MLESFRKNKQETINVILYSGQQSDTWSDQYSLNYQAGPRLDQSWHTAKQDH